MLKNYGKVSVGKLTVELQLSTFLIQSIQQGPQINHYNYLPNIIFLILNVALIVLYVD